MIPKGEIQRGKKKKSISEDSRQIGKNFYKKTVSNLRKLRTEKRPLTKPGNNQ